MSLTIDQEKRSDPPRTRRVLHETLGILPDSESLSPTPPKKNQHQEFYCTSVSTMFIVVLSVLLSINYNFDAVIHPIKVTTSTWRNAILAERIGGTLGSLVEMRYRIKYICTHKYW